MPSPAATPLTLTIDTTQEGRAISPDLVGVFFEDLSYAADGGLYAELIQNRSFEYSPLSRNGWNNLTAWELVPRGGAGSLKVDAAFPLHPNNPHYAVLELARDGEVALLNAGFDGIPLRAGAHYDFSLFARRLYAGGRWDAVKSVAPLPLVVRLETAAGVVLAETAFTFDAPEWTRFTATFTPSASCEDARLVLVASERGGLALDDVSLFPRDTFRERKNGLRPDLARTIADLRPRFVRFPGGCLVHGNGIPNFYRWKDTIGPVEHRRQQPNLWGYHQSVGLGYFEYFQFCEDIGAIPLPVVAAAVSCQNSGHTGGTGQQCLPLADMPAYIQDVLDLVEWANGPVTSTWGAKRAAAGHPAPFGLQYLGVGNEDHITPGFRERFAMIHEALRAKHPEIIVIGTVGPNSEGEDYEQGWRFARELGLPLVDEHYYKPPQWFWDNLARYDTYDRNGPKVYLGEWAAHEDDRRSTLRAALSEAAYLTALERNGDVVAMASYAPLLARRGHTHWSPNLVHFTATEVFPTIGYHVQRLFAEHAGDRWLDAVVTPADAGATTRDFAVSAVRDSFSGDLVLKLVNGSASSRHLRIALHGIQISDTPATLIVLAGPDPLAANDHDTPSAVLPVATTLAAGPTFTHTLPPHSFSVIRLATR